MTRLATHQLPAARFRAALDQSGLEFLPDVELLDRFARYGEHPAFDVLLRRHGPMVFGVCRRVLMNNADAEDAFQATFLVLVRKAGSIRRADQLGPWLYGVAYKVAARARSRALRLSARQTEATDMIPDPTQEPPDWLPILDAELAALPAKYREPLVLCELQGASRADAAKALGIPEGTLSSRLARGRDLLRKRLLKHGTLLPAGGLSALFSAGGIGRAAIPAGLLARTSELALTTGVALGGTVPAGAARLTDEVLRGMMLTKLRVGVGVVLATALVAFGIAAALPGEPTGQPEKPSASPNAAATKPQTGKPDAKALALRDRDAIQGLWVVEKVEAGKVGSDEGQQLSQAMVGKMRFLIAGDVCWSMIVAPDGQLSPAQVKLDPSKNPKWLDMTELNGGSVGGCIYELDGDRLTVASGGRPEVRPAEFTTEDDNIPLIVMHFRREKLPPAAGEKALVGSWANPFERIGVEEGKNVRIPIQRVEILDGYLFAVSPDAENRDWLGGKYTVDTTKNPKWIDLELVAPHGDSKITKLYGCYEVVDGQLELALGTSGKRAIRPLELKPDENVLFFRVKATKEPLSVLDKVVGATLPSPKLKEPPKQPPPSLQKVPELPPDLQLPPPTNATKPPALPSPRPKMP